MVSEYSETSLETGSFVFICFVAVKKITMDDDTKRTKKTPSTPLEVNLPKNGSGTWYDKTVKREELAGTSIVLL